MSHKMQQKLYATLKLKEGGVKVIFTEWATQFKANIRLKINQSTLVGRTVWGMCRGLKLHAQIIPESMACWDRAWMWYMASYICGPSSSSANGSLQQQKWSYYRRSTSPQSFALTVAAGSDCRDVRIYRGFSVEAWICICRLACGCLGTAGVSTTGGGAAMGGRTGREEGTMYSDSSSLSRASSPIIGFGTGEGLRGKKNIHRRLVNWAVSNIRT